MKELKSTRTLELLKHVLRNGLDKRWEILEIKLKIKFYKRLRLRYQKSKGIMKSLSKVYNKFYKRSWLNLRRNNKSINYYMINIKQCIQELKFKNDDEIMIYDSILLYKKSSSIWILGLYFIFLDG